MVDRLGRLGESSNDRDSTYVKLLAPPASSEWNIGRVGLKKENPRKLLGRLSAYMRLNKVTLSEGISAVSTFFLE